jgi:hypothetical protein
MQAMVQVNKIEYYDKGRVVWSTPPNDLTDLPRFFPPALSRVLCTRGDVVLNTPLKTSLTTHDFCSATVDVVFSTPPYDVTDDPGFFSTRVVQGTLHAGGCRFEHTPQ